MEQQFGELEAELEAHGHALAEAGRAGEEARAHARMMLREVPEVTTRFDCGGEEAVIERELSDGRKAIVICNDAIDARAVAGLRAAREAIAREGDFPEGRREQILRQLDEQIERMSRGRVSVSLRYGLAPPALVAMPASAIARMLSPAVLASPVQPPRGEVCPEGSIA